MFVRVFLLCEEFRERNHGTRHDLIGLLGGIERPAKPESWIFEVYVVIEREDDREPHTVELAWLFPDGSSTARGRPLQVPDSEDSAVISTRAGFEASPLMPIGMYLLRLFLDGVPRSYVPLHVVVPEVPMTTITH